MGHCYYFAKHMGVVLGVAQLRHDLVGGSGYLGFLGPSCPGVANLLGSDTCAGCCEHAFRDTVVLYYYY